ncbi:MAG: hypothetical protein K8I60_12190 [Anaerolineae bacterium]|nr:hypothetical protein [Anaerolineae bacterium]
MSHNRTKSDNDFEAFHHNLLGRLKKQRESPPIESGDAAYISKRFASFLQMALMNINILRDDFARELDMEPELANAILDGTFPVSEINDELLVEIARAIGYEPNLLRIMLNRPVDSGAVSSGLETVTSEVAAVDLQDDTVETPTPLESVLPVQETGADFGHPLYRCKKPGCPGHSSFSQSCRDEEYVIPSRKRRSRA